MRLRKQRHTVTVKDRMGYEWVERGVLARSKRRAQAQAAKRVARRKGGRA